MCIFVGYDGDCFSDGILHIEGESDCVSADVSCLDWVLTVTCSTGTVAVHAPSVSVTYWY